MSKRESPKYFLKDWREVRGLTQEELADRAGYVKSYVSLMEREERRYNGAFNAAVAAALEISEADLFHHPKDHDFWVWFNKQSPARREDIARVARALIVTEEPKKK